MTFFHYFYFMHNFGLITFNFFDFILQNTAFIISLHTHDGVTHTHTITHSHPHFHGMHGESHQHRHTMHTLLRSHNSLQHR